MSWKWITFFGCTALGLLSVAIAFYKHSPEDLYYGAGWIGCSAAHLLGRIYESQEARERTEAMS